jgi:hypothetical protein
MDKDLAAAIVLERCQCYNKSLASAKKVLDKPDVDPAELLWALRIVKSLAEVFVSQRFMDKAMECYELLLAHPAPTADEHGIAAEVCPEPDFGSSPFAEMGPDTITLTTRVNQDVFDILEALKRIEGNEGKDEAELLREGIYQLFLKYAEHKETRELIFEKIRAVVD